jgi:hypothetical protein
MKVYTYSEARKNLSELLNLSLKEEVIIKRKDGNVFSIKPKVIDKKSPFDIKSIKTKATMSDIMDAIRESRERL